jgi:hypothetical protein
MLVLLHVGTAACWYCCMLVLLHVGFLGDFQYREEYENTCLDRVVHVNEHAFSSFDHLLMFACNDEDDPILTLFSMGLMG